MRYDKSDFDSAIRAARTMGARFVAVTGLGYSVEHTKPPRFQRYYQLFPDGLAVHEPLNDAQGEPESLVRISDWA